jgi:hypothetical protein
MAKKLAKGDRVAWETSQGRTTGTVEHLVTRNARVKGHRAAATEREPQVLVKSEKSGKRAIHRPEALEKLARRTRR